MTKRFYVDTSAYLCMLLGEAGQEALRRELTGAELVSSVLLVFEAGRNLVRLSPEGLLSAAEFHYCTSAMHDDMEQFQLRHLTLDLCESRTMPAVSTPHSLDLVHLRTALWFDEQAKLTRFVSLDEEQNLSAAELGLPV
jgi:hypothetical protein